MGEKCSARVVGIWLVDQVFEQVQDMSAEEQQELVKIHVLGTGSYTSEMSFFPSFVIEYAGERTIVDPTSNLAFAMRIYRSISGEDLRFKHIRQAAVSHVHSDHAAGMIDLAVHKYYVELKRRKREDELLVFFGPSGVLKACWEKVLSGTLQRTFEHVEPSYKEHDREFDDFFRLVELEPGHSEKVGKLEVIAKQGIHAVHGGSFGYKFKCGDILIGYSGDTAPSLNGADDLTGFLAGCDMIIYECGVSRMGGHTSYEFLEGRFTMDVGERVFLTHYPDVLAKEILPFKLLKPFHCYTVSRRGVFRKRSSKKGRQLLKLLQGK